MEIDEKAWTETQANLKAIMEQNKVLGEQVKNFDILRGNMGRELGELRKAVNERPVVSTNTDSEYDPEEEARNFVKNPRDVLNRHVDEKISPITQEIAAIRNNQNYMFLTEKYPEYKDPKIQQKVAERQMSERARGVEISTVDALNSLRMEARELDIKNKEAALKAANDKLEAEKSAFTGNRPGSGSGGQSFNDPNAPKTMEEYGKGLWNHIKEAKGIPDGSPI